MAAAVARAVAKNVAGKAGTALRTLGQEAMGVVSEGAQKAAKNLTTAAIKDAANAAAKAALKDNAMKNAPKILANERKETAEGSYRPSVESYYRNTAAAPNTVYVQAPCNCPKCEKTVGDANSSLAEHFDADKYYKPLIGEDMPLPENPPPPAEMMPEVDGGRRRRQRAKTIRKKSRSQRRSRSRRRRRSRTMK